MASHMYFLITNCPGPFRLISGWVHMLEKHGNRLVFEFTLKPVAVLGTRLLGHEREFKIPFEVALMGATTKFSHPLNYPRNIRMLGRFLITDELQRDRIDLPRIVDCKTAAPELNAWQWEVVFNASGGERVGFVSKLESPLSKEWTM